MENAPELRFPGGGVSRWADVGSEPFWQNKLFNQRSLLRPIGSRWEANAGSLGFTIGI